MDRTLRVITPFLLRFSSLFQRDHEEYCSLYSTYSLEKRNVRMCVAKFTLAEGRSYEGEGPQSTLKWIQFFSFIAKYLK